MTTPDDAQPAYLPELGLDGAQGLLAGARFRIPSGLGGSFDVILLTLTVESGATVRVDEPLNPDFHNWTTCVAPRLLRPIPVEFQVRTRVGKSTGGPDDYLGWGRYPTMAAAEQGRTEAAAYPACHPIQIVPVASNKPWHMLPERLIPSPTE